jgi:hypothetical protein
MEEEVGEVGRVVGAVGFARSQTCRSTNGYRSCTVAFRPRAVRAVALEAGVVRCGDVPVKSEAADCAQPNCSTDRCQREEHLHRGLCPGNGRLWLHDCELCQPAPQSRIRRWLRFSGSKFQCPRLGPARHGEPLEEHVPRKFTDDDGLGRRGEHRRGHGEPRDHPPKALQEARPEPSSGLTRETEPKVRGTVGSGRRDCRVAGSDDGVHCGC